MRKVLIVGAGASKCWDFPLGSELLRDCVKPLQGLCKCLEVNEPSHHEELRAEFIQACRDTTYGTIDELLKRRPRLRHQGALAIAAALADHQLRATTRPLDENLWYSALYRHFVKEIDPREPMFSQDLEIVTFNYDVNIEVAIARHLRADRDDLSDALAAVEYAYSLPIHHVHGKLYLPIRIQDRIRDSRRAPSITLAEIEEIASALQFTHDALLGNTTHLDRARASIERADRLFFIGFGFDPVNLAKIGLVEASPVCQREMYSTSVGIDAGRAALIRKTCPTMKFFEDGYGLTNLVDCFARDELNSGCRFIH